MAKKDSKKPNILSETKGYFKVRGKIVGVDRDRFYEESEAKDGSELRTMNFGIKTSDNQVVYVRLFRKEPEYVYLYSSNKDLDKSERVKRLTYEEWLDEQDDYSDDGFTPIELKIALERNEKGKVINEINTTAYDGMALINDEELLYNGMDVVVQGQLSYNSYVNQNGDTITSMNLTPQRIYSTAKEIDFEDEKYVEVADFDSEFIVTDYEYIKEDNGVKIYGYTVDYSGKPTQVSYSVLPSEDTDINAMFELLKKDKKVLKYGSLVRVHGGIVNKAVETEDDSEQGSTLGALQGKRKTKITSYQKDMVIFGFDKVEESKYTEDEIEEALSLSDVIVKENQTKNTDKESGNSLLGKSKTKAKDYDDEDDDDFEDDEYELPF